MTRRASTRVREGYKRWLFVAGILLASTAVLARRDSLQSMHWAREHWLNSAAIAAAAGIAAAAVPLASRWLDRRGADQAGDERPSAPQAIHAQQGAPRSHLSVIRLHGIVEDLRYLMGKLERAASELTAAPDVLRENLQVGIHLGEEVRGVGRQLEDTLRLLEAAERLDADTSHRVDAALHQRREAEYFKEEVLAYASRLRRRLAELEDPPLPTVMDDTTAQEPADTALNSLTSEGDQEVASDVLARVDNLLREEAANLERLRRQIAEAAAERPSAGGPPAGPAVGAELAGPDNRPMTPAKTADGGLASPSPVPSRPTPHQMRHIRRGYRHRGTDRR